jgi:uncharacterized lipoprotein YddW (UPF0748 family)
MEKLPIGKILAAIGVIVALTGAYFWWENHVKDEALLQYNKTQLEEVNREQKALTQKMEQFTKDQAELLKAQLDYKDAVDQKFSGLTGYLSSDAAKKADGPANEILKRTIEEMNKARGK